MVFRMAYLGASEKVQCRVNQEVVTDSAKAIRPITCRKTSVKWTGVYCF